MRPAVMLIVFAACAGAPDLDAGIDAASYQIDAGLPDGGSLQCNAMGDRCWERETVCETSVCTYQFGTAGGTCGGMSQSPGCFCTRDASGYHLRCTGGCPPAPDGGFLRVCLEPNCGQVSCGTGTECVDRNRCE
ncbi:MAG: hypothetical protein QM817_15880 [Archangium sp.]